ncbi:MAG: hypothetical protein MK160_08010 [Rhodobacteraceae bacterium]|nr:hypothetical protein [Paracoccaceae bacterium]
MPLDDADHVVLDRASGAARALFPGEFTTIEQLAAPVGFAHGYDLGLILLTALEATPIEGDIAALRGGVRSALERLPTSIDGIMKTYVKPFSDKGFDSHEALGSEDLCLARFDPSGRIRILQGAVNQ